MKTYIKIIFLIVLSVLLFSCGEDGVVGKTQAGVFKVIDISVDDGTCTYELESKDLVTNRSIRLECECGKFQANQHLEFRPIEEYNEILKTEIYVLDSSGIKVTRITLAKDKDIVLNAYKNQKLLLDSLKGKDNIIKIKESYIKSIEKKSAEKDSILALSGIRFDSKIDTLENGNIIEYGFIMVQDSI